MLSPGHQKKSEPQPGVTPSANPAIVMPRQGEFRRNVGALPIHPFLPQIRELVDAYQVVILAAEPGAGKTTEVPLSLCQAGYRVVVTQPRRLAAHSVAEWVSAQIGEPLGGRVGVHMSGYQLSSSRSELLFCTDGLTVVRELLGHDRRRDVLMLDEVHIMNLNMEVLIAWTRRALTHDPSFRLVLMSATLDQASYAEFFRKAGLNVATLEVPGRAFPVEEQQPGRSIIDDAERLSREGRNVLVFCAGVREIRYVVNELRRKLPDTLVLPLHGDQTLDEQKRCFELTPKIVVSTNVAETSITIPDIDAVVDSGRENYVEVRDNVETLITGWVSLFVREQRKGRAGRTKPGIFIDHCPLSREKRQLKPTPEIERILLDQAMLRLREAGVKMEEFSFLHQPVASRIAEAKRLLTLLGCLDEQGEISEVGRQVCKLPVSARIGRMILEAEKKQVRHKMATVAALIEVGGIVRGQSNDWRSLCKEAVNSDLLAQSKVLDSLRLSRDDARLELLGIRPRLVDDAFRVEQRIKSAVTKLFGPRTSPDCGSDQDLLRAICSGMPDWLYCRVGKNTYVRGSERRQIEASSAIPKHSWVVGIPFDRQSLEGFGQGVNVRSLGLVSAVDPLWINEYLPERISIERMAKIRYEPTLDAAVVFTRTRVGQWLISEGWLPAPGSEETALCIAAWITQMTRTKTRLTNISWPKEIGEVIQRNRSRFLESAEFNKRARKKIIAVSSEDEMRAWYAKVLGTCSSLAEVADAKVLELPLPDAAELERAKQAAPTSVSIGSQDLTIRYDTGKNTLPEITIGANFITSGAWRDLPGDEVRLNDGSPVSIRVELPGGGSATFARGAGAKAKIAACLIERAWLETDRSQGFTPNYTEGEAAIPNLIAEEFTKCPLTGASVLKYRALVATRGSSSGGIYNLIWYRDRKYAEGVHAASVEILKAKIAELRNIGIV